MQQEFQMINVGQKPITFRLAIASGVIAVGAEAFDLIKEKNLPKGDALKLAEIAGILGAKKAYEMIPLCHPMGLDQVQVRIALMPETHSVELSCIASTHAKTGVEMEALAGVSAGLLAIWDLAKMINADLEMHSICLLLKQGGKSGLWLNPKGVPEWIKKEFLRPQSSHQLAQKNIAVLIMSDRASAGIYEDKTGKLLQEYLASQGGVVIDSCVVPDDRAQVQQQLERLIEAKERPDMLICSGGTGVSSRDITPQTLRAWCDYDIPGIGEFLRSDGSKHTPLSWGSRSFAGVKNKTLVVCLPGNPKAVKQALDALMPHLLPHLLRILEK